MTTQNTDLILAILAIFQLATLLLVLVQHKPILSDKKSSKKRIVLDTSAVIDGRILALAEAGFLSSTELISTNIILDELQYLADEGDSFKRSRARYGLDILNKLSGLAGVSVVTRNLSKSEFEVDQQLLNLAKSLRAQLFTADFNLAQRAKVEGVSILSPNDLAESLKPQILPGENFTIKLIQKGDDKGQAIGYLPDGTMVVAENSQNKIGQNIELKSSKIIQTAGGRIVFAQQVKQSTQAYNTNTNRQKRPRTQQQNMANSQTQKTQNLKNKSKSKEDSLIDAINSSK
ncbi:MAG: hypothetical protein H6799_00665 [Candidatus Nomurabacteria bacterium]|nr:MAG: hypothetical protein H6799_00665 [Candidatus Nomurabacteria bacterium]HRV75897.1 hypothetical protein [Candidatus Saccharimonadales bacterium]